MLVCSGTTSNFNFQSFRRRAGNSEGCFARSASYIKLPCATSCQPLLYTGTKLGHSCESNSSRQFNNLSSQASQSEAISSSFIHCVSTATDHFTNANDKLELTALEESLIKLSLYLSMSNLWLKGVQWKRRHVYQKPQRSRFNIIQLQSSFIHCNNFVSNGCLQAS